MPASIFKQHRVLSFSFVLVSVLALLPQGAIASPSPQLGTSLSSGNKPLNLTGMTPTPTSSQQKTTDNTKKSKNQDNFTGVNRKANGTNTIPDITKNDGNNKGSNKNSTSSNRGKNPIGSSSFNSTSITGSKIQCNIHQSMSSSNQTIIKTHQKGLKPEDCYDALGYLLEDRNGQMMVRMNGTEKRKSCGTCRLKFEMGSKNLHASLESVMFGTGKQRTGGMTALLSKCTQHGGQIILPAGPGLKSALRIDVAKAQIVKACSPMASSNSALQSGLSAVKPNTNNNQASNRDDPLKKLSRS
ncbi:hypothetical protein PCANC_12443 [Puccinia coronata f. sp. avenae]|uniref:Uncharacterized protein n=1 Tax=Puccinia coronata f. sp. avenae TaxID=200324 RepID=A0A2N5UYP3_9BASI|nr:hypothetical protein PCASD_26853 [Puccinia coronata f. sp. avenae]PLW18887.1 hypothetical protein PCANC_12443 [Puccinia coronata f. sp. avenae]PLW42853.1 hypothetical protein PCASD_07268 [Puccinia coronata f. sp. avenae]